MGYCQQYLQDLLTDAKPVNQLPTMGPSGNEMRTCNKRSKMEERTHHHSDKSYILDADASDVGAGVRLSKIQDNEERK